jgi:hypothetical protein
MHTVSTYTAATTTRRSERVVSRPRTARVLRAWSVRFGVAAAAHELAGNAGLAASCRGRAIELRYLASRASA